MAGHHWSAAVRWHVSMHPRCGSKFAEACVLKSVPGREICLALAVEKEGGRRYLEAESMVIDMCQWNEIVKISL